MTWRALRAREDMSCAKLWALMGGCETQEQNSESSGCASLQGAAGRRPRGSESGVREVRHARVSLSPQEGPGGVEGSGQPAVVDAGKEAMQFLWPRGRGVASSLDKFSLSALEV